MVRDSSDDGSVVVYEIGQLMRPHLVSNVELPSDRVELNDRLKVLFLEKLKGLKEGVLVEKELGTVKNETERISRLRVSLRVFNKRMCEKHKVLEGERTFISNRIEEFTTGIRSIEEYLEDGEKEERDFEVLRFGRGEIEWGRIYMLMMRECRRLDNGLPIYAHRREILTQIYRDQVGGSGNSLVTFEKLKGLNNQS